MAALTIRRLRALTYPADGGNRAVYVPDGTVERLYARVYPSGRKSFVVRYYAADGRKKNRTLGTFGTMTLQQARDEARAFLVEVDLGREPERRRSSKPEHDAMTFGELARRYMEHHTATLRSGAESDRRIGRHLLPRFETRRVTEVTVEDVLSLKRDLGEAPYEANRVLEIFAGIFNKGVAWQLLPAGYRNPVTAVEKYREERRQRVLTPAEMARLRNAIDGLQSPNARVYLTLMTQLPFRRAELLRARWDELDGPRRVLAIRSTSDKKRVNPQPLTDAQLRLIESLRAAAGDSPWIFPGKGPDGHMTGINTAWSRVREAAALTDVRMHDLRRTVATRIAEAGASEYQIQHLLGHSSPHAARHYVHMARQEVNRELLANLSSRADGK